MREHLKVREEKEWKIVGNKGERGLRPIKEKEREEMRHETMLDNIALP